MIGEINQSNLYLLLPAKVSHMAVFMIKDKKITLIEAIKRIYTSDTYKLLEKEETKMWHLGPVDLYNETASNKPQTEK